MNSQDMEDSHLVYTINFIYCNKYKDEAVVTMKLYTIELARIGLMSCFGDLRRYLY